jgi:hypothetical protein
MLTRKEYFFFFFWNGEINLPPPRRVGGPIIHTVSCVCIGGRSWRMCTMSNYELGTSHSSCCGHTPGLHTYETMSLVTLPHYSICCEMLRRFWFVVLCITPPVCLVSSPGGTDGRSNVHMWVIQQSHVVQKPTGLAAGLCRRNLKGTIKLWQVWFGDTGLCRKVQYCTMQNMHECDSAVISETDYVCNFSVSTR